MVEIPKCNTKISKNTNYIANDKSQVQKHLAVKEESQMPLNILLAVNCYQKNLLKITAFEDAGFKYSIKIIPKKERPNNIQPVQIMSPEETAGTLEKMSLFDLLAKIINLESKDASKLMCKLYDSNKGKAVYSQLLQMRLIDKAVEISVAAINTNPVITGYQIEKLKILELVELITNMENEAAAKVLCNLINNDKVATAYKIRRNKESS